MAAFGSLTLSWPRVWAHHACCFIRSANSDIPTLFNFQPVPQSLFLRRRRHSIASFAGSKPSPEVFKWISGICSNQLRDIGCIFKVQSSNWGFTLMLSVTMNILHLVVGMPRDVVWRQTRHVSGRLHGKSYLPWTWHPLTALAASKVLVNVVHALRDQEARVKGLRVPWGSGNARRTGPRPKWIKQNQTMKAVVVWCCMHRCTNLWLDTGFVYFSCTSTVVYSFILLIPFGVFGRFVLHVWTCFRRFLVVHRSPTKSSLGQIMVQGWLRKHIEISVSWRDFATVLEVDLRVGQATPLIYDEFDGEISKDDNARSSKSNVGKSQDELTISIRSWL